MLRPRTRGRVSEADLIVYYSIMCDDPGGSLWLPGQDSREWVALLDAPWDDVDRFLIGFETQGA